MKKKSTRAAAFLLAVVLTVSAAACGNSENAGETTFPAASEGTYTSAQETPEEISTESASSPSSSEGSPETTGPVEQTTGAPAPVPSSAPALQPTAADGQALGITAQSAVLYSCADGKTLVAKRSDNLVYPASTAKLLTAIIALRYVPLSDAVTVGDELDLVQPHSSLAYLAKGQQLTMDTLLHALLIPSGNDAAYTIAAHTGRVIAGNPALSPSEAVSVFVNTMNQIAAELGMKNSFFTNPDGYDDPKQQTTAEDLALLGAEFVKHPELTAITSLFSYDAVFTSGERITWKNTNALIDASNANYVSECIGLKTGSSAYSGNCLVSAFTHGGQSYIAVVMNSSKAARWSDSILLYQYLIQQ